MKWIVLAWKNLLRSRRRTLLTTGAVTLALFIFITLQTILSAMQLQPDAGIGEVRLAVLEKYGGPRTELPETYGAQLARFAHIMAETPLNFNLVSAGGSSSGPFYITFAVDPEAYRIVFASVAAQVPMAEYQCFVRTQNGALVGAGITGQYRWQIGDQIKVASLLDRRDLELTICGVLHDRLGTNQQIETEVLVNRAYYVEAVGKQGKVNLYWLRVDQAANVLPVIKQVSNYYANGPMEVTVQTESSMLARFSQFTATIRLVIQVISAAVLFTILIVTANTITLSMRERKQEIAVMKALGYTQGRILSLIVLEASVTALGAGGLGTMLAWSLFQLRELGIYFGIAYNFEVTPVLVATGLGISLALGVLSSLFPAYRAARVNVITTLHSV